MLKRKTISRRSPLAASLVMLGALLVTGGGYVAASTAAESTATSTAADQATIDTGHKLFLANCASCHGKNAEGTAAAPTLIGVGAAAVDFQVSTGRMPAQASGPQISDKAPQFTDQDIAAMAAYVASLAPGPAIPSDSYLAQKGNLTHGGELFRINCAMCHNATGAGGALTGGKWAPSLKDTSPKEFYEAMVTGPQNMPVFSNSDLSPADKLDIITYLQYVQNNPSVGGDSLGDLGPVAEGLFVWVIVLGAIVGITIWLGAKSN